MYKRPQERQPAFKTATRIKPKKLEMKLGKKPATLRKKTVKPYSTSIMDRW